MKTVGTRTSTVFLK